MPITAEKSIVLVLKDETGQAIGVVIRDAAHWVFYALDEMDEDGIGALFALRKASE